VSDLCKAAAVYTCIRCLPYVLTMYILTTYILRLYCTNTCVVLNILLCIANLAGLLPASFALLRQMRFCRRQYMPLDSAEDANASETLFPTHTIAAFKPASLSPNRETFVGRGENEA